MYRTSRDVGICVAFLLLGVSSVAGAEVRAPDGTHCLSQNNGRTCKRLLRKGATELHANNTSDARGYFVCAYDTCGSPDTLIAIARTYQDEGNLERALDYSQQFLEEAPPDHSLFKLMQKATSELRRRIVSPTRRPSTEALSRTTAVKMRKIDLDDGPTDTGYGVYENEVYENEVYENEVYEDDSSEPSPPPRVEIAGPLVSVAAAIGMNSPGGFLGIEADYRVSRLLTVGLSGGYGLWGTRVSPTVKLEHSITPNSSAFLEGAMSFNLGGKGFTSINGERQEFEMGLVPAASVSVGGRTRKWGPFWTGVRVGISVPLVKDRLEITGGGMPTTATELLVAIAYPGGLVVGWMAGASF